MPSLYANRPGVEIIAQVGVEAIRAKSKRQTALLIELAEEAGFHGQRHRASRTSAAAR